MLTVDQLFFSSVSDTMISSNYKLLIPLHFCEMKNDHLYTWIQLNFALKLIKNNEDTIYTTPYSQASQKSLKEPHEVPYLA